MNGKSVQSILLHFLGINLLVVFLLFTLGGYATATTISWNNTLGGSFQSGSNWDGGTVPEVTDIAVFNTGGNNYTVAMDADQTNYRMELRTDDVTLDLQGSTHTITGNWSGAYVGKYAGDDASLALINGTANYVRTLSVGEYAGSEGHLLVDGATLRTDSFKVGNVGTGAAMILGGGQVLIDDLGQNRVWIGLGEGAVGNLMVGGAGTRLYGSGTYGPSITVGGVYHTNTTGKGRLQVFAGGEVNAGGLSIAARSNNIGDVLVTDENSRLEVNYIAVGAGGKGTLSVVDSGRLSATSVGIGNYAGGTGVMTLLRNGQATIGDELYMYGLSAELIIGENSAMFVAGDAYASAWKSVDKSTININGEGSVLEIGNNLYLSGEKSSYPGYGNFVNQGGQATLNVENKGRLKVANDLLLFNQAVVNLDNSGTKGLVTVGDLSSFPFIVDFLSDYGFVLVGSGGSLNGTGTINGHVFNLGGTVAPGFSPGIMTINGDYTQETGGVLNLEVGGLGAGLYDQLLVSGDVFLDGTLNLIFIDDFLPETGDLLADLITFSSLTLGDNFNLSFRGISDDWLYETLFGTTGFNVRSLSDASAPVPEPSTLLLLGCGVIGLAWYRRRQNKV